MIKSYTEIIKNDSNDFTDIIVPLHRGHLCVFSDGKLNSFTLVIIRDTVYYVEKDCELYKSIKQLTNRLAEFLLISVKVNKDNSVELKAGGKLTEFAVVKAMGITVLKEWGNYELEDLSSLPKKENKRIKNLSNVMYDYRGCPLDLVVPIKDGKFIMIEEKMFSKSILVIVDGEVAFTGLNSTVANNIYKTLDGDIIPDGSHLIYTLRPANTEIKKECITKSTLGKSNRSSINVEKKIIDDILAGEYSEYSLIVIDEIRDLYKKTKLNKDYNKKELIEAIDKIDSHKDFMEVGRTESVDD